MDIFIKRLQDEIDKKGITQRELAKLTGVTEVTISRYLSGERKPRIEIIAKIAEVLNVSVDHLLGQQFTIKEPSSEYNASNATPAEMVMLPILGDIRAGKPLFADEHLKGHMPFPKKLLTPGYDHFLLTIDGDSMTGDGIDHGDTALIRVQDFVEYDGQIAAVVINGCETCLKHVIRPKGSDMAILRSSNTKYQDIIHPLNDLIINSAHQIRGISGHRASLRVHHRC
ncbi:MAG TPA: helix-turn-helix domain-containing protein [Clostridiaceae bacterium]|nr:helix-turn-helix domain-containing protein [Clostridiaceae bacterium]